MLFFNWRLFIIFAFVLIPRILRPARLWGLYVDYMSDNNGQDVTSPNKDYRRTIKYLGIFGGAQGLSMFLNIVRNKFASILLGARGLGFIALYNRTLQMFSECTNLSLSFSAVRKLASVYENEDEESAEYCVKIIRSVALLTGLVGMLLFMMLSPFISNWIFGSHSYYVTRFLMLSPVILFMAVSGGEVAVMRGVRRLNSLALYSVWTALSSVAISVPLYFVMGLGGIFPSIFFIAFFQMAGALFFTLRIYRYRVSPFSLKLLRDGVDMIKMGAGYIYSSILTSLSVWLVCKALSQIGDGASTGLFSAGFTIICMLPSILFAALDSDYYPRLSGIFGRHKERNEVVNGQIEVHILIQAPLILGVIVLLPELIPLLYSNDFEPALKMTQIAMFALLFNTVTYPLSFMPLSKGDSFTFLVQESIYNVSFVVLIVLGYSRYGLTGVGVAMAMARVIDLISAYMIAHYKYSFSFSSRVKRCFFMHAAIYIVACYSVFVIESHFNRAILCFGCVACSVLLSMYMLSVHGNLLYKLFQRLFKRKG